jgi:anti-sigma factor ChrR (cupin superfamily)
MTPGERGRFEEHLQAGCDACSDALRQLAHVSQAMAVPELLPGATKKLPPDATKVPGAHPPHLIQVVRAEEAAWADTPYPGVSISLLHTDRERGFCTALVRMAPHAEFPEHVHSKVAECVMIDGEMLVAGHWLKRGDYMRMAAGVYHTARAGQQGCLCCVTEPIP